MAPHVLASALSKPIGFRQSASLDKVRPGGLRFGSSSLLLAVSSPLPPLRIRTAVPAPAETRTEPLLAAGDELKVLGTWRSPFALRVRLALNFKGLGYEYLEEDLDNKSDLLLQSNPVTKKLPVLIHNDVPICESLVILEYIDEKFAAIGPSLLPADHYERAMARFWATYIDSKLVAQWLKMFRANTDKQKAEATRETIEAVETLEGLLLSDGQSKKPFFGGDDPGYVDVVLAGMIAWMQGTKALCGVELLDAAKTPLLLEWTERFAELDAAKLIMPDLDNLVEFAKVKRAKMMNQN
ncbi:hypothetical protein QYE76_016879 [Lolium multiflorum]|uniref:glutathione transferase n=1 Tax=Lolium multiflorum TaxID=4521 RepID=A0AAD8QGR4_LOLMU|nr:hypothetical protein QYE76_016879 [Lolium multiflorum]